MASKKHVLIVGDLSEVPALLLDGSYDLTLIRRATRERPSPSLYARVYEIEIKSTYDVNAYLEHAERIIAYARDAQELAGPIWRVVAPMEQTILPGALVRSALRVPGLPAEVAWRLRDKAMMKEHLRTHTALTLVDEVLVSPQQSTGEVLRHCQALGFPLIVKPRMQAGSRGIVVCHSLSELEQVLETLPQNDTYIIEKFIDSPIIHIDGLIRNGSLSFVCASRYVHTCLEWVTEKKAMASVLICDPQLRADVIAFSRQVLEGLQWGDGVFHLEAFLGANNALTFLEIAARPGGAGIVTSLQHQYGVNLADEAVAGDLLLARSIAHGGFLDHRSCGEPSAGWVVTPFPSSAPCVVRSLNGMDRIPYSTWHCELPWPGKQYNRDGDEGLPSGKFYLQGRCEETLRAELLQIAATYSIDVEILLPL